MRRMRTFRRFLPTVIALALSLGGFGAAGALAATASGARLGIHGEGVTRFVLDLSETVPFKVTPLANPYRIAIELSGTDFAAPPHLAKPWGSVNSLRLDGGRIVLDLRKPALVKTAFIIPPRDGVGPRFVVDLADTTRDAFLAAAGGNNLAARKPVSAVPAPAPAPVPAKMQPAAPEPPPAEASLPPAEVPAAAVSTGRSIVVTSPNAAAVPQADTAPARAPAVVAEAPVKLVPPMPMERPQSADRDADATRSGRAAPMLSAPMPPPPERPAPVQVKAAPVAVQPPPAPPPVAADASEPDPQQAVQRAVRPVESAAKGKDGVPVIVIDPGHGGVDPGATGVSGTYEKHITLAMARELKSLLDRSGRYRVYLTRDRDVFIRLRERVAIARAHGADLFISLHADAVSSPQIRGLSVYTLSRDASDNEAQALAEKENKADLIAGIDLTHESSDVTNILIDLAQRETMNRSAGFATDVVDEVGQEMDLLGNTHRFAGFAVLKAPDVPAILVEMGYLSNETEEKHLRQPQYRAHLAKAIAKAVDRFFPSTLKAKRP